MLRFLCIIITCCLSLTFECFSQNDTIVDQIKYNYIQYYDDKRVNELGNYTIRNQTKIKTGAWVFFDQNSNLIAKGNYYKNKKSGFWIERNSESNEIWRGNYKRNKRIGEWYCENQKKVYRNGKEKHLIIASYN